MGKPFSVTETNGMPAERIVEQLGTKLEVPIVFA